MAKEQMEELSLKILFYSQEVLINSQHSQLSLMQVETQSTMDLLWLFILHSIS